MRQNLVLLVAVLLLAACGNQSTEYPPRDVPAGLLKDQASIKAGKQLFMHLCARCHGHPSEGRSERANFFQPPAPDFNSAHYRQVDPAYLYWRIETGKTVEPYRSRGSVMPAWGPALSSEQIWHLVAYLKSRSRE